MGSGEVKTNVALKRDLMMQVLLRIPKINNIIIITSCI